MCTIGVNLLNSVYMIIIISNANMQKAHLHTYVMYMGEKTLFQNASSHDIGLHFGKIATKVIHFYQIMRCIKNSEYIYWVLWTLTCWRANYNEKIWKNWTPSCIRQFTALFIYYSFKYTIHLMMFITHS